MGRLDDAISPYLQSHANQPVDWFSWGPEAFAEAARRDVPVLISIGYHTCHWCHVMSRESFSRVDIAQVINDSVVAIKVDREEHPDVDAVYMAQAQAFSEHLGWPLTVFTTPEGGAIYAATYLPPTPSKGLPSLPEVVTAVSQAWTLQRDDVVSGSLALVEALGAAGVQEGGALPSQTQLGAVVAELVAMEDTVHGGFGGAPKFPCAPVLGFLLGRADAQDAQAHDVATRTLRAYAGSALRDPVEGGFFRYATQRDFSEPHYERMLTDNAGLLAAYARAGDVDTAAGIVSFFRHQLLCGGGLASGSDSESIIDGVQSEGGYFQRSASERARLAPPALDDKIVSGWNGAALEALALAHRAGVAGEPGQLALDIAHWLIAHHIRRDGSLIRLSRAGVASAAVATTEDYGGLAFGLLEVATALSDLESAVAAKALVDRVKDTPELLVPDPVLAAHGLAFPGDINEGQSPSGPALLALAALRLAGLSGDDSYREFAIDHIRPHVAGALLAPRSSGGVLRVLSWLATPPRQLVVVEGPSTPGQTPEGAGLEMAAIARSYAAEGALSLVVNQEVAGAFVAAGFALLEGREKVAQTTAYVCEGGVCQLPVTTASQLVEQLAR